MGHFSALPSFHLGRRAACRKSFRPAVAVRRSFRHHRRCGRRGSEPGCEFFAPCPVAGQQRNRLVRRCACCCGVFCIEPLPVCSFASGGILRFGRMARRALRFPSRWFVNTAASACRPERDSDLAGGDSLLWRGGLCRRFGGCGRLDAAFSDVDAAFFDNHGARGHWTFQAPAT